MQFETRQYKAVSFSPYVTYTAANLPRQLVTADFNKDGKPDLALVDDSTNQVGIYLNNGTGGFGTATTFPVGNLPVGLAVGDLNKDGKLDLLVTNQNDNSVSFLAGDGSGGFATAVSTSGTTFPEGVALGDFNNDGALDAAVSSVTTNTVVILIGDGTGKLSLGTPVPVGVAPRYLSVADLNKDGYLDLVVPNPSSNTVSFRPGKGDGTFGAGLDINVGMGPYHAAVADVNHDQNLDILVANRTSNTVSVLLGDGAGSFSAASGSPYAVGIGPVLLTVADFDGDGNLDIVTADNGGNTASILTGDGMGGFSPVPPLTVPFPHGVAAADFNGDNLIDFAMSARNSNEMEVFLSNASPLPNSTAQSIGLFNGLPTNVTGYGKGKTSNLATYSNQTTAMGVGTQLAYYIKVGITVAANQVGTWGFRVGPDFSYGGTIVVDGVEVVSKWTGLNWNHNFTNPTQSLTGQVSLSLGLHVLEVYGFSSCCDRSGTVQFTAPGISSLWIPVSNTAINTCG